MFKQLIKDGYQQEVPDVWLTQVRTAPLPGSSTHGRHYCHAHVAMQF